MSESQVVECISKMQPLEKLEFYMNYFIEMLGIKYTDYCDDLERFKARSFQDFCDISNVSEVGPKSDDWKEKGYASRSWLVFNGQSLFHYVYYNQHLKN